MKLQTVNFEDLIQGKNLDTLDAVCREWGFFELTHHPIENALREELLSTMKKFFALSPLEKKKHERTELNHWGYYDRELTKNALDWKELYDVGPSFDHCIPQWPIHPERFRPVLEAFSEKCHQVALQLVSGLARAMTTNPSELLQGFDQHTSFLRLNYYPTCEDPAPPSTPTGDSSKQLGISHHSDAGAVTVLMVDGQDGLQVERDGQWFTVETKPLSIVVNIGDMVQVWSNDRYTAPLHRVLASDVSTRYSAPYFLNPSFSTSYAPLNSMCQDERPRYKEINWGAFREGRAAGDYADVGDEIQIAHYRVVP
ncbi:MAG: 2OG-Fe(II) oxygenase family protein [Myxococcota bacterium]|nr:2OG-Fe(II) oxygenase family protein [Myxococcota bacterium]